MWINKVLEVSDTEFKFKISVINRLKKIYDHIKNFVKELELQKELKWNSGIEAVLGCLGGSVR